MTDTLPAEAIEACPLCGSNAMWNPKETTIAGKPVTYDLNLGFIDCVVCGLRTPGLLSQEVAIKLWNRRAALPHIRGAEDHYFAVDYTGCIHEAPDRETAIKWAEDFARTANGGAIGSERRDVAAMLADAEARVAPSPTSVPEENAAAHVIINRKAYLWPHPTITGAEVKRLAASEGVVNLITHQREEDPEVFDNEIIVLKPGDRFIVRNPGTTAS